MVPISAGIACALSLRNKLMHKIILNKYNRCKKQYRKDQQTPKFCDKLYSKSLQDNLVNKREYENMNLFVMFLINPLMNRKMNLFYESRYKTIFFSDNKIKMNLELGSALLCSVGKTYILNELNL